MSEEHSENKAKILIVDDEVFIAKDLESRLKAMCYTVCGKASSGLEALELVEQHRPDLVMTDIVLQGEMDGIDAAEVIREKYGIPVVFITAYADAERLERAKLTYPFGYLLKPFQDRDLKITTEMALYVAKVDADRRKLEESLRKSEQKYKLLFNHAPAGIFEVDFIAGKFTEVNDIICEYTGYDMDDLLTMGPLDILTEESKHHFIERLDKINKGESVPSNPEFCIINKDGSSRWVQLNVSFRRRNEITTGAYVVAHDISDRKQAEESLRRSQMMLARTEGIAQVGSWEWEIKTDKVTWSEELFRIFLLDPDKGAPNWAEHHSLMLYHPDDLANLGEAAELAMTEGEPYELELRAIRRDGETRIVLAKGFPDVGPDRNTERLFGSVQDITERKKQDERMRVLMEMINNAPSSITVHDMEGRFLYANQKTFSLHGYEEHEFMNINLHELDVPESEALIEERIRQIKETGEAIFEVNHYHKDGTSFPLEVCTKIFSWDGEPAIFSIATDITEKKMREEALHASENKYRILADNASDVIFTLDMDLNYTYISPSVYKIRGYTPEEVMAAGIGQNLSSASAEKALHVLMEELGIESQTGSDPERVRILELEMKCKDGSTIWSEVRVSFLRDDDGKPTGIIGVSRNISDRKKAKEELKESEQRKELALSGAELGTWDWNATTGEVVFDERWAAMLGYQLDELVPHVSTWENLMHPDDIQHVMSALNDHLEGKSEYYETEHRVRHKGGNWVWILDKGRVITRSPDGAPLRVCGTHLDVTEKKRAEELLKTSEKRFQKMLSVVPDMISIHDPDMNIIYSNWRGFAAVPEANRLTQTKCYRTYRQFDEICPDCRAKQVIETGVDFQEEVLLPSGMWVDLRVIPSLDEYGQVDWFMEWVRDITEAKQSEEHRARLQAQLQQAQKMEAVGTLAGGVAHDFNNLLQVINGYTELLLMNKSDFDPDYSNLMAIQNSASRASDLVRSLLLFSRKAETESKPMELNIEVERARTILERTIPKMVEIDVYPGRRLWTIMADPVQIEQIILNLGSNAADAMPDGGKLTIETANITLEKDYAKQHANSQPGRYVLLTISDTGHGIDKETQKKIFEPFFTTKEFGKGTGLGLASVYGIVKSHDGYITFYSEVGQGTTFKIYLPAMEQSVEEKEKDIVPETPKGGDETILLVDDEVAIRGFAQQALMKFGYKVTTASTGEEALDLYQEKSNEINLVVMDLGMPGMGGHKCLQELLQLNPSVKIIIASGYSINGQVKKSMDAGAMEYISKPYQSNELLNKVRKVLDEKEHRGEQ